MFVRETPNPTLKNRAWAEMYVFLMAMEDHIHSLVQESISQHRCAARQRLLVQIQSVI